MSGSLGQLAAPSVGGGASPSTAAPLTRPTVAPTAPTKLGPMSPVSTAPQFFKHVPAMEAAHDQAKARYQATSKGMANIDHFNQGLGMLGKMGDAVTPEDVIQEAGKLVAQGQDPAMLAGFLADMPTSGGMALAAWVKQHQQTIQANELQVQAMHGMARHQLGVSALQGLAAHALNPQASAAGANPQSRGPAASPQSGANALTPQGQ